MFRLTPIRRNTNYSTRNGPIRQFLSGTWPVKFCFFWRLAGQS